MTIETAIAKLTSGPAKFINPRGSLKRGVIKEGMTADLVLLGKNDYGVKKVILGGKLADEEELVGQVLRRR